MKKNYQRKLTTTFAIAISLCTLAFNSNAQKTYNRKDSTSVTGSFLENVRANKMIFGAIDPVNNGKDQDLLVFGVGNETTSSSLTYTSIKLYNNNGSGTYTLNSSSFDVLDNFNGAWSKLDGKIIITGLSSGTKKTELYKRDGTGTYTKVAMPLGGSATFAGVEGYAGFLDYDSDGDDDVFLADVSTGASYLYQNLGVDNYALVSNPVDGTASFPLIIQNSYSVTGVVIGDYNKDNKPDIVIVAKTGTGDNTAYTSIYKNNGNGTFSKVMITLDGVANSDFPGISRGSIDMGDLGSDGYATDIAVGGFSSGQRTIKVFKQDETDVNTYTTIISFQGVSGGTAHEGGKRYGQMLFGDLAGSGFKKDLITTGQTNTGYVTTEVMIYTGDATTPFKIYSRYGAAPYPVNVSAFASFVWDYGFNTSYRFYAFGDIDGDGKKNDVAKFGVPSNSAPAGMASLFVYNNTPLPVTLTSYTAVAQNNRAKLSWTVAKETNNAGYTIQKSTDGKTFTTMATEKGNVNSSTTNSYVVYDNNPAAINYYKLIQTDLDGTVSELGIEIVKFKTIENTDIVVYPNPTKGNATIIVTAGKFSKYSIVNIQGNTVAKGNIGNDDTEVKINLSSSAKGTYIIKLTGANNNATARIIKL